MRANSEKRHNRLWYYDSGARLESYRRKLLTVQDRSAPAAASMRARDLATAWRTIFNERGGVVRITGPGGDGPKESQ
jgi:hypothetical protein